MSRGYLWEDLHAEVVEMFYGLCVPMLERAAFALYAEAALAARDEAARERREEIDEFIRCIRRRTPIHIEPEGRSLELEAEIARRMGRPGRKVKVKNPGQGHPGPVGRPITWNGETRSTSGWAKHIGISTENMRVRLKRYGMTAPAFLPKCERMSLAKAAGVKVIAVIEGKRKRYVPWHLATEEQWNARRKKAA